MRRGGQRGRSNVLAAQTSPRTERERLASLLDVLAILIDPSLRLKGERFMPVLFRVGHRPSTGVHFRLVDKQGQHRATLVADDVES